MRRYDDPVEVRRGMVGQQEGPEQFLWRGRLWKVRDLLAHWVETGPWWASAGALATVGSGAGGEVGSGAGSGDGSGIGGGDLLDERELWRVEAGTGPGGGGVFDLSFSWTDGSWQLVGCQD
ncbi:DUF6504 family protein [Nocardioides donggukensis]|uniref:DUF6504 domain-containing protein n=1 Tax=Nocardioides donggukensis TaxID=2774019 RepID=A0A927K7Q2_9ACTN|nr:DUF6504 family protein [Nocardioides donggukensis]MBD8869200.1 hypothetical protein [Nocardioides donggukensis]